MWSRRAKEYKDRINSGDIFQTAEVLRDLIRDVQESERSFSERNIFDIAVYRIASEYAVVKRISYEIAEKQIVAITMERMKRNSSSNNEEKNEENKEDEDEENKDSVTV
jgi:CarD family transcriptional regulator